MSAFLEPEVTGFIRTELPVSDHQPLGAVVGQTDPRRRRWRNRLHDMLRTARSRSPHQEMAPTTFWEYDSASINGQFLADTHPFTASMERVTRRIIDMHHVWSIADRERDDAMEALGRHVASIYEALDLPLPAAAAEVRDA